MKLSRLKSGQRATPSWVAERMRDRPDWRCRTEEQRAAFTDFVLQDLALRSMQAGAMAADLLQAALDAPASRDGREKPWLVRAFADAEQGARAVPLIREIFEDYWTEGRETGRQYRGHDPSAEQIAAIYAGCSIEQVQAALKKGKAKRPSWR